MQYSVPCHYLKFIHLNKHGGGSVMGGMVMGVMGSGVDNLRDNL